MHTRRFQEATAPPLIPDPLSNVSAPTLQERETEDQLPSPLFRLKIQDLSHPATESVLAVLSPLHSTLQKLVDTVLASLYPNHNAQHPPWPGTRSITLVLSPEAGVAATSGRSIDRDHKIIVLSQPYVSQIPKDRLSAEVRGVLLHEIVHCWQYSGCETAPGGLIEGIADFVRLRAGLNPPHWKRDGEGEWDRGYQHTAYFLDWVERKFGSGSVSKINAALRIDKYNEEKLWASLFNSSVHILWEQYVDHFKKTDETTTAAGEERNDSQKERKVSA